MDLVQSISTALKIPGHQVRATMELLDTDNTIPFIARYRKEITGGLDEEQLRLISQELSRLRALDERRATVLTTIEEQGKLTPDLSQKILDAQTLTELEDLYQPYKPKRRTRAGIAREKGLQGLADLILQQPRSELSMDQMAAPFLNDQVENVVDAYAGASDIVAETISDHADIRRQVREKALQWGVLRCEKLPEADDPRRVYELYYELELRVDKLRPHQVLAINRGEAEKVLRVRLIVGEADWQRAMSQVFRPDTRSPLAGKLQEAMKDAAERLLLPAIERDVRRELTEKAETHAIQVFVANLRALLSQPPLAGHTILGIDPGIRTGCKVAVVDPTGKLLDTETIYPFEPRKQWDESIQTLAQLVMQYGVTLVSIGNGTASRDTEKLVAELIKKLSLVPEKLTGDRQPHPKGGQSSLTRQAALKYLIVNEAGASVYSASPLARAELPDLDVSLRGAVSIARRVQDPLAELVKIDPRSIGVGMYQHDVDQKRLSEALTGVVESVVNAVGVDLNTASPALLTYVSGVGPKLAERVVEYRNQNGPFRNRMALRKVTGLGPKAFEQSAGFLRIRGGDQPLDASAIHPESYPVAEAVLKRAGLSLDAPLSARKPALDALLKRQSLEQMAGELGVGVPTLQDVFEQLIRPGRDPRQELPLPILRSDVLAMDDLQTGMRLKGVVRNVVDFGAFIDIGVKQDGLLHRSQIPQGTVLGVGDVIEVEIQKVEVERSRIGLCWVK